MLEMFVDWSDRRMEEKSHFCSIGDCGRAYARASDLKKHKSIHSPP